MWSTRPLERPDRRAEIATVGPEITKAVTNLFENAIFRK
jgi:hypothetical protein